MNQIKRKTVILPVLPKLMKVKPEVANAGWNKHLPAPLIANEKVMVIDVNDWGRTFKGFVKVKHNKGQSISIFSLHNFLDLQGRNIKLKPSPAILAKAEDFEEEIDREMAQWMAEYKAIKSKSKSKTNNI